MEHVRPLTPDDADAYVALRREMLADTPEAFGSSPDHDPRGSNPAFLREALARPEYAILGAWPGSGAESSSRERLLACAGILREESPKRRHLAFIWGVYATPAARGRGVGRAVVQAAVTRARTWPGVAVVELSVSEATVPALRLYESLGFVRWGFEPDALRLDSSTPGHGEIHMQLRL